MQPAGIAVVVDLEYHIVSRPPCHGALPVRGSTRHGPLPTRGRWGCEGEKTEACVCVLSVRVRVAMTRGHGRETSGSGRAGQNDGRPASLMSGARAELRCASDAADATWRDEARARACWPATRCRRSKPGLLQRPMQTGRLVMRRRIAEKPQSRPCVAPAESGFADRGRDRNREGRIGQRGASAGGDLEDAAFELVRGSKLKQCADDGGRQEKELLAEGGSRRRTKRVSAVGDLCAEAAVLPNSLARWSSSSRSSCCRRCCCR